jgi:hypothetical protein
MTPNLKPTCHHCGEDIEPDDETHEDEGYIYHLDCWDDRDLENEELDKDE